MKTHGELSDIFVQPVTFMWDVEDDQWMCVFPLGNEVEAVMYVQPNGAWDCYVHTWDRTHALQERLLGHGGEWTVRDGKWAAWRCVRQAILAEIQAWMDEDECLRKEVEFDA